MNQELDEHDCDKIAVPVSMIGRKPKIPFRKFFFQEILPTIFCVLFLLAVTTSIVYVAHQFIFGDEVDVVNCDNYNKYVVMTVSRCAIIGDPPVEIIIMPVERTKDRKFLLTPESRSYLEDRFMPGRKYRFVYNEHKHRGKLVLERIEEVK